MDDPDISTSKSFIFTWMEQLKNTRNDILGDDNFISYEQCYYACEQQLFRNYRLIWMSFPWICSRVNEGKLVFARVVL